MQYNWYEKRASFSGFRKIYIGILHFAFEGLSRGLEGSGDMLCSASRLPFMPLIPGSSSPSPKRATTGNCPLWPTA